MRSDHVDSAKLIGLSVFLAFIVVALLLFKPTLGLDQLASLTNGGIAVEPHVIIYGNGSIGQWMNFTVINSLNSSLIIYNVSGKYFELGRKTIIAPKSSDTVLVRVTNGSAAYACLEGGGCNVSMIMGFLGINVTETTTMSLGGSR